MVHGNPHPIGGAPDPADLLPMVFTRPKSAVAGANAVLAGRPTPYDASIARQTIGIVEREFGDVVVAVEQLRQARRLARRSGSPDREADVLATLGIALIQTGRATSGLRALNRAVTLAAGLTAARVRFRRAGALRILGRHREALADVRLAVPALRRARDTLWTARALTLRALLHLATGSGGRAEIDFRVAEAMFATIDHEHDAVVARQNRALVALRIGDLPAALSHLDDADRRFRQLGTPMYSLALDRCAAMLTAGLADDALREADRALRELEQQRGQRTRRAELLLVAAQAALSAGDPALAVTRANAAGRLFARQQRMWWHWHARLLLVQARFAADDVSARQFAEAATVAGQLAALGSPESTQAHLVAGQLALRLGRRAAADGHLVAAARARRADSPLQQAGGWLAQALQAEAAEDLRGLRHSCRQGLDILDRHRLTLGATELRAHVTRRGDDLAALAQRSCLPAGTARDLLGWSERWRSVALAVPPVHPPSGRHLQADLASLRDVARRLGEARAQGVPADGLLRRQHRLEQQIGARLRRTPGGATGGRAPGGATAGPPGRREPGWARLDVELLLASLGDDQLVDIVAVDGQLYVLLCGNGAVRRFHVGALTEVVAEVEFARSALRRLAYGRSADERSLAVLAQTATRLQEQLLGPAARHLRGDVVIVPPGRLHAVPWALLPVLHDRAVSVAPSAGAWLRARNSRPPVQAKIALVRGPGLTGAGAELAQLAARYPDATVLQHGGATAARVLAAIDGSSLAHIAAHGTFRADNPLFSSLLLDDGPLTVHDVEQLHRAPHRLVLPSCDSAVLSTVGADELLGLASVLLPLGTAAIVASTVPVNDEATVALMLALHDGLLRGESMAAALRDARLASPDDPLRYATGCSFIALGAG